MFGTKGSNGLESLIHRPQPSKWQQFWKEPCLYVSRLIHRVATPPPLDLFTDSITIVCISDTHNSHSQLEIPDGEILIHSGDATQSGTLHELQAMIDWLDTLPHRHKIVIGGNHDLLLDSSVIPSSQESRGSINWRNVTYLENEEKTFLCEGGRQVRVYGSPMTPRHGNWAFQYPRSRNVWRNTIPEQIDILVTHGPPKSHLDLGHGCEFLLEELWRTRPKLHVFGHIHAGYGQEWIQYDERQRTFERLSSAGGGIWLLLLLLYRHFMALFAPRPQTFTQLINASIVGSLRDQEIRAPYTARI